MKNLTKSFIAIVSTSIFAAGLMFAADSGSKVAACCTKAQGEGKACAHSCCVEAAKAGNNCTKCGGAGKIVKAEAKK